MREKIFLRRSRRLRLRVERARRIVSFRKFRFQVLDHTRSRGGDRGMTVIPFKQRDLFGRRVIVQSSKEIVLHIQLVSMLRWCMRPDVIWRHVPNGEHRDPRTAAKLKAMGVLPGSADLEFFWREAIRPVLVPEDEHGRLRALFLELKRPGGTLSTEQATFGLAMRLLGAEYLVASSVDEAIGILGAHGLIRPDVEVCGKRWGPRE